MKQQITAKVTLTREALDVLFKDVYQRQQTEACGVLLGTIDEQGNWYIEEALPLQNIFASPVYFEFAPEELLQAELEHPGRLVGVYHSHPTGFTKASSTDCQNMQRVNQEQHIPWVWLIIMGPFDNDTLIYAQESLFQERILAYHHYEQEGLQQVAIQVTDQQTADTTKVVKE